MEEIIRNKCVYQLRLANRDMPFYVGQGHIGRPKEHFYPCELAMKLHKNNVINKAIRNGIEVLIEYIFIDLTISEAKETEKTIIALYGRENLTNGTDGGDGTTGPKTEDHKRKIGMAFLLPLDKVIERFISKHGDRYDYSLVKEYKGQTHNVEIMCREHGIFLQCSENHWNGRGCHECAKVSRVKSRSGFRHTAEHNKNSSISRIGKKTNLPLCCCVKCHKETKLNLIGVSCDCPDAVIANKQGNPRLCCLSCKKETNTNGFSRSHSECQPNIIL